MRFYVIVRKGFTENLCEPCASELPVPCIGGAIGITLEESPNITGRCDRCAAPIAFEGGFMVQFSTAEPYESCPITKFRPIPELAMAASRCGWSEVLDLAKCLLYAEDENGKYYACITPWCKDYDDPRFMGMFFGDKA